jgi:DNA repair protein RadC
MKLRELPENERPREKLIYRGKSSLSNAELIAILIRTGSRDMSALRLAEKLLSMDKKRNIFTGRMLCRRALCRKGHWKSQSLPDIGSNGIGEAGSCHTQKKQTEDQEQRRYSRNIYGRNALLQKRVFQCGNA